MPCKQHRHSHTKSAHSLHCLPGRDTDFIILARNGTVTRCHTSCYTQSWEIITYIVIRSIIECQAGKSKSSPYPFSIHLETIQQEQHLPFVADGLHCAAAAGLEPVCQFLQVSSADLGQQGLGELGLILPAHHKVLVLEMAHILIPQILQIKSLGLPLTYCTFPKPVLLVSDAHTGPSAHACSSTGVFTSSIFVLAYEERKPDLQAVIGKAVISKHVPLQRKSEHTCNVLYISTSESKLAAACIYYTVSVYSWLCQCNAHM